MPSVALQGIVCGYISDESCRGGRRFENRAQLLQYAIYDLGKYKDPLVKGYQNFQKEWAIDLMWNSTSEVACLLRWPIDAAGVRLNGRPVFL